MLQPARFPGEDTCWHRDGSPRIEASFASPGSALLELGATRKAEGCQIAEGLILSAGSVTVCQTSLEKACVEMLLRWPSSAS